MLRNMMGFGACAVVACTATALAADRPAASQAVPSAAVLGVASAVRLSRIRLNTGVELQVAESGPVTGEPVLFLHGYTDSWFSFSAILDGLAPDIRAIVPTHRGHGDSERPACCYGIVDIAADAVALLDALGIARASVVGHSMGSFVAQRIAIEHPERVDRLVLIGSGPGGNTAPALELNRIVQELPDVVPVEFIREFQQSTAAAPLPEAFLEGVVRESGKLPGRLWRELLAGIVEWDVTADLPRIRASTLIVWGEHDGLMGRAEQEVLLQRIARSRLLAYADMGHAPNWEQPARFVADLNAFLSGN